MKVKGKVTRVVPTDDRTQMPARVFFAPDDPGDRKKVDGSKQTTMGEIMVVTEDKPELGASVEYDV